MEVSNACFFLSLNKAITHLGIPHSGHTNKHSLSSLFSSPLILKGSTLVGEREREEITGIIMSLEGGKPGRWFGEEEEEERGSPCGRWGREG